MTWACSRGRRTDASWRCWPTRDSARQTCWRPTEYCVESAIPDYRAVAGVRERAAQPAVAGLDRRDLRCGWCDPEVLLEVFATALYREDEDAPA